MSGDDVVLAYVHGNQVAHSWEQSKIELIGWDMAHHQRVLRGGFLGVRYGTDGLIAGRNTVAEKFLSEKSADWLFWLDTDMGFAPDIVDRLLEVADPVTRPIVGALCFAQRETERDGLNGWHCAPAPTIYDWLEHDGKSGFAGRRDYPVNTVVQCAGTGSAAVLIHRSVFERIHAEHGPVWYNRIPNQDRLLGEDLSFCLRAGAVGAPVLVHTGVKTHHFKNAWVGEHDFWRSFVAPPATDRTAVLVPVMRRPQNAAPFMESLRASTGLATVYAIADVGDHETHDAWKAAGAVVLATAGDGPGTFAEKVNIGYREAQAPWLFITGDDVRFRPGWLDHAQHVAHQHGASVVGTNDLGNPLVRAGEHATHLLISRQYVDELGASWDGPGVVAHEGYRHWFVDDEIVTAAKQRGVWGMALGSVVEHLHPRWGKGEPDSVYELGESHAEADKARFAKRLEDRRAS